MEHIIYKTTNLVNGRYYIGMHSTKNVEDGYLGSGKRLMAEVKKYGIDSFERQILFKESSREALKKREAAIVNEELLKDPLCLNLRNGGEGGGGFSSEGHREKWIAAGRSKPETMVKINATIERRKKTIPGYAVAIAKNRSYTMLGNQTFLG
jgi:hypothetical protein